MWQRSMDWDLDHFAIATPSAYHSEHITPAMKHCGGSHAGVILSFFDIKVLLAAVAFL